MLFSFPQKKKKKEKRKKLLLTSSRCIMVVLFDSSISPSYVNYVSPDEYGDNLISFFVYAQELFIKRGI